MTDQSPVFSQEFLGSPSTQTLEMVLMAIIGWPCSGAMEHDHGSAPCGQRRVGLSLRMFCKEGFCVVVDCS